MSLFTDDEVTLVAGGLDGQTEKTLVGEADSQSEKTRIMSLFTDDDSIKSTDHKARHRHTSNDFPFLSTVDDNAITSSRKNTGSNDGNGPHNFNTLGSLLSLEEKEMAKEKNRHSLGPAALITMLKGKKVDQDEDPLNSTRDRVASTGSNDSTLSSGSN